MKKIFFVIAAGIILAAAGVIIGARIMLSEKDAPRIPKLEIGTDVYAFEEEIRNILGQECVSITTDRSSGSGILWSYDGKELRVVTAGHLMTSFVSGELELWSGEKLEFSDEDVKICQEADMAIISLDVSAGSFRKEKGGASNFISKNQQVIGDSVWILDSIYGPASGINTGQVYAVDYYLEDYGMEMLLLSGNGSAGMSGCAVYDAGGQLAAMMSGMSEDGSILAAISAGRISDIIGVSENK